MIAYLFSDLTRRLFAELITVLIIFGVLSAFIKVHLAGIILLYLGYTILHLWSSWQYQRAGNPLGAYERAMKAATSYVLALLLWIGS